MTGQHRSPGDLADTVLVVIGCVVLALVLVAAFAS